MESSAGHDSESESDNESCSDAHSTFEFRIPNEAPVFQPTEEQFKDPLTYIESIRLTAQAFGICKIIPPPNWHPPYAVDIKTFEFKPRVQRINELEAKTRIKLNFLDQITKFWDLQGTPLSIPSVEKKVLDLYTLYSVVQSEGGSEVISKNNRWGKVARRMGMPNAGGIVAVLKSYYENILLPFHIFQSNKQKIDKEVLSEKKTEIGVKIEPVDFNDPLARYICKTCTKGDDEEKMLLCDGCDDSYHTFCLEPPLTDIPKGDWRCPKCVAEEINKPRDFFGFEQAQKTYKLVQFGERADQFKSDYFNMPVNKVTTSLVEKEFWRIVSSLDENITVEYGADLHTMEHGSGFPTRDTKSLNTSDPDVKEYINSKWNLNNLPILDGSVLKYIDANISGMKVPWMYVGMCFSTFCWHNEDHWSYSINYLHWGEAKTWYGVPGSYADNFEATMMEAAPELFQNQPDLLHQLTTIMNPNVLMDAGVPVYRTDQNAGEFVITFPRAYHAGFNQGYNFAEAVNFTPADWLKMGRACITNYASLHRYCVFSHDELVCAIALDKHNIDPRVADASYLDMNTMIRSEALLRKTLLEWGVQKSEREAFELVPDDLRQCDYCKTTIFLSAVVCGCAGKIVCLHHYNLLCNKCPTENHILRYRYAMDELSKMQMALRLKCEPFKNWSLRAENLLSQLSDFMMLLHEVNECGYPDTDVVLKLREIVKNGDKCTTIAKELFKSRSHNAKPTLEEVSFFIDKLITLPCVINGEEKVLDLLNAGSKMQENIDNLVIDPSITVTKANKLLKDSLKFDIRLNVEELEKNIEILRWIEAAESLNVNKIKVDNLEDCISEGITLLANVKSIATIKKNIMTTYISEFQILVRISKNWDRETTTILNSYGKTYKTCVDHLQEAMYLPITVSNFKLLSDVVAASRIWLEQYENLKKKNMVILNASHQVSYLLSSAPLLPVCSEVAELKSFNTFHTSLIQNIENILLKDLTEPQDLIEVLFPRLTEDMEKDYDGIVDPYSRAYFERREAADRVMFKNVYKQAAHLELTNYNGNRKPKTEKASEIICKCKSNNKDGKMFCVICRKSYHGRCNFPGEQKRKKNFDWNIVCDSCKKTKGPKFSEIRQLVESAKQNDMINFIDGEALKLYYSRCKHYMISAEKMFCTEEIKHILCKEPKLKQLAKLLNLEHKENDKMNINKADQPKNAKGQKKVAQKTEIYKLDQENLQKLESLYLEGCLLEITAVHTDMLREILQVCYEAEEIEQSSKKRKSASVQSEPKNKKSKREDSDKRKKGKAKENEDESDEIEDSCAAKPCRHPKTEPVNWVQCDTCNKWYHLMCLGVSKREIKEDVEFNCKYCTAGIKKRNKTTTTKSSK